MRSWGRSVTCGRCLKMARQLSQATGFYMMGPGRTMSRRRTQHLAACLLLLHDPTFLRIYVPKCRRQTEVVV